MSNEDPLFVSQLKQDFPDYNFVYANRFKYRPSYNSRPTIYLEFPNCTNFLSNEYILQTLHELGHALSLQQSYTSDIDRLKIEREAWELAHKVFTRYSKTLLKDYTWDEEYIEDSLDTYRDWLHSRSKCKSCGLTRYQTPDGKYHCPYCETFTAQNQTSIT